MLTQTAEVSRLLDGAKIAETFNCLNSMQQRQRPTTDRQTDLRRHKANVTYRL